MDDGDTAELRTADTNGITLAYRVVGDPADPPMVLLHGLGDDERDWGSVLPALAAHHRVYALDLRGHGGARSRAGTRSRRCGTTSGDFSRRSSSSGVS